MFRAVLLISYREDRHVLDEALRCVSGANARDLRLFTRDILVRLVHGDDGAPRTEPLIVPAMRAYLAQSANIRKATITKKNGFSVSEAPVPPNLASEVLALPADVLQKVAPPLAGITQLPIVRPHGSIRTSAGYDPVSSFMLDAPRGLAIPAVPDVPTDEQVREAVLAFDDLLADFPFVDEASRANALAMMLTPIVRPAVRGCVPPFVIDAPRMGTGKGLLCDVVSVAVTGRDLEAMTLSEKEEEVEKRITSILLGAPAVARIDNVGRPLDSDHLCSLWTSQMWEGRYLGHSKMLKLPNETTWLITLNNARLEGDVPRRVVYVRLDARVERPWERSAFRHPDLLAHAKAVRGRTIWAALVLVRRWAAEGCPAPTAEVPTKGSYEEWRRIVGGILRAEGHFSFWHGKDIRSINFGQLEDYHAWLAERVPGAKTILNVSNAFKTMLKWLVARGELEKVPPFPKIAVPEFAPRIISAEELERILAQIPVGAARRFLGLRLRGGADLGGARLHAR